MIKSNAYAAFKVDRMTARAITVIFLLWALAGTASSGFIIAYDNGGPNTTDFRVAVDASSVDGQFVSADDFMFDVLTTVEAVRFWFISADYNSWNGGLAGTVQYRFFSDSGLGFGYPTVALTPWMSGDGVTVVDQGDLSGTTPSLAGVTVHQVDFGLVSPAMFSAGTRYWLAIHLGNTFNSAPTNHYWATASLDGTGVVAKASNTDPFDPVGNLGLGGGAWFYQDGFNDNNPSVNRAFQLYKEVPAPAPLLLLGLGLCALIANRRRRRDVSAGMLTT